MKRPTENKQWRTEKVKDEERVANVEKDNSIDSF